MTFDKTDYRDALNSYKSEKNHYESEITKYIGQIESKYRRAGEGRGWILAERSDSREEKDTVTHCREVERNRYRYEMDTKGNFYVFICQGTFLYPNNCSQYKDNWKLEYTGDLALQRILPELDFKVSASYYSDMGREEIRKSTSGLKELGFYSGDFTGWDCVTITRISDEKGYGLYCALKEIAEGKIDPIPIDPGEQEKKKERAAKKAYARTRRPYTISKVVVALLFALICITAVFAAAGKVSVESLVKICIISGICLLPATVFLNYANAWVHDRIGTASVRVTSFFALPVSALSINAIRHRPITTIGALFDMSTFAVLAIFILIVIIHCAILLDRK